MTTLKTRFETPTHWLRLFKAAPNLREQRPLAYAVPLTPSGSWRRPLFAALEVCTSKAVKSVIAKRLTAMDPLNAWDPEATYQCPRCKVHGQAEEAFGARMALRVDVLAVDAPALVTRARRAVSDIILAKNPPRVVEPSRKHPGAVRVLLPIRQSNCRPCRRESNRVKGGAA